MCFKKIKDRVVVYATVAAFLVLVLAGSLDEQETEE